MNGWPIDLSVVRPSAIAQEHLASLRGSDLLQMHRREYRSTLPGHIKQIERLGDLKRVILAPTGLAGFIDRNNSAARIGI